MAEQLAAWGIEIGQAGLKAMRLRYAEAANQVVAVAFDYVPHPKLLSQPDAVPEELIRQALDTFLSRNPLGSDLVAISLPGKDALAKFIQLPPVESAKVAEIVKYEARQQIPFPLEDVYWDYQTLGSGSEEGGFLLDAEVGLIAMKREQVNHHLKPFLERKIEVEAIQIAPLALYNFLCYDRLGIRRGEEQPAIEDYTVLLDMGADNTTLMVTNGRKIWIRNVPVGGNHFTRALTKEMKLTFAKAEHLKCNATKSPDPRAVFQALRPVFNDYVSEIQRSIGFFASVNRQAKIGRLIGVGNGFKLAGLQKFLQQNLQYEVERIDSFQALAGDHVLNSTLFHDNILTFPVPYGLALQLLKQSGMRSSLLPAEISTARMIRRKKPWAAAAAASVLIGLAVSAGGYAQALQSVNAEKFAPAEKAADEISQYAAGKKKEYADQEAANKSLRGQGDQLVADLATRELWIEVYKAIDECLPRDVDEQLDEEQITRMNRISIKNISCRKVEDLETWFKEPRIQQEQIKKYMREKDRATGPTGKGYIFTLHGVHFHDEGKKEDYYSFGTGYVEKTLLTNLQKWEVEQQNAQGQLVSTPVRKLGISHATITYAPRPQLINFLPGGGMQRSGPVRPGFAGRGRGPVPGAFTPSLASGGDEEDFLPNPGGANPAGAVNAPAANLQALKAQVPREDSSAPTSIPIPEQQIVIEFAWKPTTVAERLAEDPDAPKPEEANAAAPAADQKAAPQ